MEFTSTQKFNKQFRKLDMSIKIRFRERRELLRINRFHPLLHMHSLHGKFDGCLSVNVTGDYRAIFFEKGNLVVFIAIGTHAELYGK